MGPHRGTFAARILTEAILGREHDWAPSFTPSRLSFGSLPKVAQLGSKFSALMAVDRVTPAAVSSAGGVDASTRVAHGVYARFLAHEGYTNTVATARTRQYRGMLAGS